VPKRIELLDSKRYVVVKLVTNAVPCGIDSRLVRVALACLNHREDALEGHGFPDWAILDMTRPLSDFIAMRQKRPPTLSQHDARGLTLRSQGTQVTAFSLCGACIHQHMSSL
jgi:hypothetical protein